MSWYLVDSMMSAGRGPEGFFVSPKEKGDDWPVVPCPKCGVQGRNVDSCSGLIGGYHCTACRATWRVRMVGTIGSSREDYRYVWAGVDSLTYKRVWSPPFRFGGYYDETDMSTGERNPLGAPEGWPTQE